MSILSILSLAGAMLLLAVTPGPGVFATVARALASGFRQSTLVILGIVVGDLVFLLSAIFGLSAVAENLHGLFITLKYVGAAYLVFLGIKLWRDKTETIPVQAAQDNLSWQGNFLSGLLTTLGNPKVILFYLGFLPTFVDLTSLSGSDVVVIATVVSMVLGLTMLAYAYMACRAKSLLPQGYSQRWVKRSAGSVMVATGSVLAVRTYSFQ